MDGSQYCVYIVTDDLHSILYTGWTGNLKRRVSAHRSGNGGVFTRRYNLRRLVYYERLPDANAARLRERQLKRAGKKRRVKLIEELNPTWIDLYDQLKTQE
jgi:putative endonuclease